MCIMNIINVYQAKTHLSSLIDKAVAGEEVVIARNNQPLVKLTPYLDEQKPREFGPLKGQFIMSPDFDAVDAEIEELFYGAE